jgi:hypothetical protein
MEGLLAFRVVLSEFRMRLEELLQAFVSLAYPLQVNRLPWHGVSPPFCNTAIR